MVSVTVRLTTVVVVLYQYQQRGMAGSQANLEILRAHLTLGEGKDEATRKLLPSSSFDTMTGGRGHCSSEFQNRSIIIGAMKARSQMDGSAN